MADVSVNVGVSGIGQFKQGMADAQASVKTFDAALKSNEKELKRTGDAEKYMEAQTTLLNGKIKAQREIVKNAEQALKQMEENGVKTTSRAYQDMQRRLIEANSAIIDTEMQMENLGTAAQEASGKTDKLGDSLGGLNRKVSLEQVIGGVNAITNGLEKGAKKAIDLGKAIWDNITDVARFSDDAATQAMILGMDVEDYQAYKKVFDTVGEITVQEWQKAKLKVQNAINDPTQDQADIMALLGLKTKTLKGDEGVGEYVAKNFEDFFWEIGETLQKKVERGELTPDLADVYANALFGKGFAQLKPMFNLGKEGFAEALEEQIKASQEAIEKNAQLNDTLIKLQGDFETLKVEVLGGLAPALTKGAETLDGLLERLMKYLESEEGQKALEDMEKAVSGLFEDLGEIDPEAVISGFTDVFNTVIGSLQWLVGNEETLKNVLIGVVSAWGALKVTGGILDIVKVVSGMASLVGAEAAGKAAGAAWGSGLAGAVMKAAPWLVGLYTLLHPSDTHDTLGNNELVDEKGQLTPEALAAGYKQDESGNPYLEEMIKNSLFEKIQADIQNSALNAQNTAESWREIIEATGMGPEDKEWQDYADELARRVHEDFEREPFEFVAQPKVEENAAAEIEEQIGTVNVPVNFVYAAIHGGAAGGGGGGKFGVLMEHANGLPYVPFDGYMAMLHKGEQVVPARSTNSRNYTSNLYMENVNVNGGVDADGLAARIAAEQRRIMSGYGSR